MRAEAGFFLAVALMFIFFSGEPDIKDAIVYNLTNIMPIDEGE